MTIVILIIVIVLIVMLIWMSDQLIDNTKTISNVADDYQMLLTRNAQLWRKINDLEKQIHLYQIANNQAIKNAEESWQKEQQCRLKDSQDLNKRIVHFENLEAKAAIQRKKAKHVSQD